CRIRKIPSTRYRRFWTTRLRRTPSALRAVSHINGQDTTRAPEDAYAAFLRRDVNAPPRPRVSSNANGLQATNVALGPEASRYLQAGVPPRSGSATATSSATATLSSNPTLLRPLPRTPNVPTQTRVPETSNSVIARSISSTPTPSRVTRDLGPPAIGAWDAQTTHSSQPLAVRALPRTPTPSRVHEDPARAQGDYDITHARVTRGETSK
ncbi:hypothetical protein PENSPDRAFT_672395, partial [Peniophora sp. CONT]